jgi:hypothetical protein
MILPMAMLSSSPMITQCNHPAISNNNWDVITWSDHNIIAVIWLVITKALTSGVIIWVDVNINVVTWLGDTFPLHFVLSSMQIDLQADLF